MNFDKILDNNQAAALLLPGPDVNLDLSLTDLNEATAIYLGQQFAMALLTHADAQSAVDEYIREYKALREFDAETPLFRIVLTKLAKLLLRKGVFGANLKLYIGAGLSVMDMVTDVIMINQFFAEGRDAYEWGSIVMRSNTLLPVKA